MRPFLFCIILFWFVACENDSLSVNEPPLGSCSSNELESFSSSVFLSLSSEQQVSSSSIFTESSSSSVLKSSASVSVFKGLIIQNGDVTTTETIEGIDCGQFYEKSVFVASDAVLTDKKAVYVKGGLRSQNKKLTIDE